MNRLGCHKARHLLAEGGCTALSVAAAPERGLVFAGFSDGSVAVWTANESEAFMVTRCHDCDTTSVKWVQAGAAPWAPALITGGGDGKVITWNVGGSEEDFGLWSHNGVE